MHHLYEYTNKQNKFVLSQTGVVDIISEQFSTFLDLAVHERFFVTVYSDATRHRQAFQYESPDEVYAVTKRKS